MQEARSSYIGLARMEETKIWQDDNLKEEGPDGTLISKL